MAGDHRYLLLHLHDRVVGCISCYCDCCCPVFRRSYFQAREGCGRGAKQTTRWEEEWEPGKKKGNESVIVFRFFHICLKKVYSVIGHSFSLLGITS